MIFRMMRGFHNDHVSVVITSTRNRMLWQPQQYKDFAPGVYVLDDGYERAEMSVMAIAKN